MHREHAPEVTVPPRRRGVNGLPDDLIDYSDDKDAVGGSHDDELAQPSVQGQAQSPATQTLATSRRRSHSHDPGWASSKSLRSKTRSRSGEA